MRCFKVVCLLGCQLTVISGITIKDHNPNPRQEIAKNIPLGVVGSGPLNKFYSNFRANRERLLYLLLVPCLVPIAG